MSSESNNKKLRTFNIGITAHVDAGKTTLTEQLLYHCGAIRSVGSVDSGTASTDQLPVEKDRGISVKSSCATIQYKDIQINILDTPGHSDFVSEVQRSLAVLDFAVLVVSAVEGIQAQTKLLIDAFIKQNMPFFVFINKLDRAGSNSGNVIDAIAKLPGKNLLPFSLPINEGSEKVEVSPIDYGSLDNLESAVMACCSELLLEKYLTDANSAAAIIGEELRYSFKTGALLPYVFGSTKYGIGIEQLLDFISEFATESQPDDDKLSAIVFKVSHDKNHRKQAHVRMFSGKLENRIAIRQRNGVEEKITQLQSFQGVRAIDSQTLKPNQIGRVYGLDSVKAGDILGEDSRPGRQFPVSEPLLLSRAMPKDDAKITELIAALEELSDEDPSIIFEWIAEKKELQLRLSGSMQIEIVSTILANSYGIETVFSKPSVIYKETPVVAAEGFDAYTMPKPCWAVLHFLIEPLPRGSGLQYSSKVSNNRLLYRYQNHVETAVPKALTQGLYNWEVTDLRVTLIDGEHHVMHTHPLDFFLATPLAIMDGLKNCGTKLLEPVVTVNFLADSDFLGKTMGLLPSRRGSIIETQSTGGRFLLTASMPLSETLELPIIFASLTGGTGIYSSAFSHYAECPPGFGSARDRTGVNPLERSKYILAMRSALETSR